MSDNAVMNADDAVYGSLAECFFTIEDRKFKIKCFLCRTVCPYCFGK